MLAQSGEERTAWTVHRGEGPLVATALHEGHQVRPEIDAELALSDAERRREEDPFTSEWTTLAPTRVVVLRSRFEVDMNRPPEGAIYRTPSEAWGLQVWRDGLPDAVVRDSMQIYDAFYREMRTLLEDLEARHGRFVVYDLHSYNHRRRGPRQPPSDARKNPEVNIGTANMDRDLWSPVVDAFRNCLSEGRVLGRQLDVRENVRFEGGYFCRWVHDTFPGSGCCLAIEVKKFYMDEWSGEPDQARIQAVGEALARTVDPVMTALRGM